MITIEAYAAVLTAGFPPGATETVTIVPPARSRKTHSPAAAYALAAARHLPNDPNHPLITICGPTGSTCANFDGAWKRAEDGRLTGAGFAEGRYKRIFPLTLITGLQNQISAVLSMELGQMGPCLNALEGANALAEVLPNIAAFLEDHSRVLLVAACAGDRDEERVKQAIHQPQTPNMEGAVALLLAANGQGPGLALCDSEGERVEAPPVLQAGLGILRALEKGAGAVITTQDGDSRRSLQLSFDLAGNTPV